MNVQPYTMSRTGLKVSVLEGGAKPFLLETQLFVVASQCSNQLSFLTMILLFREGVKNTQRGGA